MVLMGRVVLGDHVLAHRQFAAVGSDEFAHVVAGLGRIGEPGERTGHGVARREHLVVAEYLVGLLVAGHADHTVMGEVRDRALRAEVVEVRVRIVDERHVGEEVDRVEIRSDLGCSVGHPRLSLVAVERPRDKC